MSALVVLLAAAWLAVGGMSGTAAATPPGTAAPAAAAGQPAAPVDLTDAGWPREIACGDEMLILFQPQLEGYEGNRLQARAAIGVRSAGAQEPDRFGVVWMSARTEVDKVNRQVTLDDLRLSRIDFPTASDKGEGYLSFLAAKVPAKSWVLSLDRLEAALAALDIDHTVAGYEVKNDPPRIFYSNVPALLVLIDGQPVLQPVAGTALQRVVNTRVLIVFDAKSRTYYLHLMEGWLQAPDLNAGWTVVKKPSKDLQKAGQAALASKEINMLDGPPVSDSGDKKQTLKDAVKSATVPTVYLSLEPAELIQTTGTPQTESVPGTELLWVTNTGNNLFVDPAFGQYYVLLSGRWFRAKGFSGPWEYVPGAALPAGFARIPPDHPKASVLASVPGTGPAKEAVVANAIPQTAAINRAATKLTVTFDGEPKFKDISGTSLEYAVNSKTPVIRVAADSYWAVENAVWFAAPAPLGPWTVAVTVPAVIYTIPPSSPIHFVTYARIYGFSDEVVYVGYTPGYYGTVVTKERVVVYGTGWYYPPYLGTWWYGWPCTYGYAATFVWTSGGGWAVGFGVGYGWGWYYPYWGPWYWYGYPLYPAWGWGAWGGFAAVNVYGRWSEVSYAGTRAAWANPWTGNYGRAARYGAYNPNTGAVAGVSGFRNTNIYTGNTAAGIHGAAYNPETGRFVAGGAGYIGNIYSGDYEAGGRLIAYDKDTQTGFAVNKNNVYAGKDGNVYKYDRDSGNWYERSDGGWNPVDPPEKPARPDDKSGTTSRRTVADRTAATDRTVAADRAVDRTGTRPGGDSASRPPSAGRAKASERTQSLDRDFKARSQGEYRSRQFQSQSGNWNRGGAGRSLGGARGGHRR